MVEKAQGLTYLARTRGLRPWVLSRQTKLGVNASLKPGTALKFDTSHIVPTEVSHGLVVNLPELLVYQFHKGSVPAAVCRGGGQAQLAHPHRHLLHCR